jgi:Holliday junction resolvase RusA-like endonuclease
MRSSLIVPMMMFGKFRSTVAARDEDGNTIILRRDAKGRPVYKKTKSWTTHSEKNGDKGIYPSVNHIYTRMAKGRQKLTAPAEGLKRRWEAAAFEWVAQNGWALTSEEKVIVELTAYFPNDKVRRDTNNVFKLLLDSFNGIIYDDDEFALPRVMDFHRVAEGEQPYFELTIYLKSEEDEVLMQRVAS